MKKSDLIAAIADKKNLTGKQATEIVDLMFKGFINEFKKDGRIEIRGFGAFTVREYKAYKGKNPKTGDAVNVKPKRLPHFKAGRELKKMVDGK